MSNLAETIDRALTEAGIYGADNHVRQTIDSALAAAGLLNPSPPGRRPARGPMPPGDVEVIDVPSATNPSPGSFTLHTHRGAQGSLAYKLYVPSSHRGEPMPLVVMLHGCKQNPDDFAAGTRMNALAERRGFLVAYPAQTRKANGGNCWNWFQPEQQRREGREPALIAGIVGDVAKRVAADRQQVFVAGLSAGAALAVILGRHYPEVFAGIAVHSGLPLGAAHDVQSAFAAMRGQNGPRPPAGLSSSPARGVRTLVLHGDADATVAPSNGDAAEAQAVSMFERSGNRLSKLPPVAAIANGRHSVRTDHVDDAGRVAVRTWRVQGGGHHWFGGSPAGSFTSAAGPDASAEAVAFFLDEGRVR